MSTPMPVDFKTELLYETFRAKNKITLPYRLFMPRDIRCGERYPLILFLHGAGERGDDNESQLRHVIPNLFSPQNERVYQSFVVVPQMRTSWTGETSIALWELLQNLIQTKPVDTSRLYAIGISMGAFGIFDLMARHHEAFAAGIPICGGADPQKAPLLTDIPLTVFHGAMDPVVPVGASRDIVAAIRRQGGEHVNYTEYPKGGHNIWETAIQTKGLIDWLFSQQKEDGR